MARKTKPSDAVTVDGDAAGALVEPPSYRAAKEALGAALEEHGEGLPHAPLNAFLRQRESLERQVLASFVDGRPELTPEERADGRGLVEAALNRDRGHRWRINGEPPTEELAPKIDALAGKDSEVRATIVALWERFLAAAEQGGRASQDAVQRARAMLTGDAPLSLQPVGDSGFLLHDDALLYRLRLALFWPAMLDAWRKERAGRSYRMPAPLLTPAKEATSLSAWFGKNPLSGEVRKRGDVMTVSFTAGGRPQRDLFVKEAVAGKVESSADVLALLHQVLTPRAFRVVHAGFCMAQEDRANGEDEGFFSYTPSRLGDLLGLRGKDRRLPPNHVEMLDEVITDLGKVGMRAQVKVNGELRVVETDYLFAVEARVATQERKGRRSRVVYRVNRAFWSFIEDKADAYYITMPRSALAPPDGVGQQSWDVSHLILSQLQGHARVNAAMAKAGKEHPWRRSLQGLVQDCHSAPPTYGAAKQRKWLLSHLSDLGRHEAGLLSFVVEGEGEGAMVAFDLPFYRPHLRQLPPKKKRQTKARSGKALSNAPR
jgi:hypothetical protein